MKELAIIAYKWLVTHPEIIMVILAAISPHVTGKAKKLLTIIIDILEVREKVRGGTSLNTAIAAAPATSVLTRVQAEKIIGDGNINKTELIKAVVKSGDGKKILRRVQSMACKKGKRGKK